MKNERLMSSPLKTGRRRRVGRLFLVAVVAGIGGWYWANWKPALVIPAGGGVADWPEYGRDAGGTRFAPLSQITPGNVMHLEEAWVYRTGEDYTGTQYAGQVAFEATPILVDGTLFLSTPASRVIALDPETGAEKWTFDPKVNLGNGRNEMTTRGVSAWRDPDSGLLRIVFASLDARLFALDAATGLPIESFGTGGMVDLTPKEGPYTERNYSVTSPPAILNDRIVVGSAIGDNSAADLERGVIRAFDVRTGSQIWGFDPIPRSEDHPAWNEWQPEQAQRTGGANAWSILSVDAERDLVFAPTGSASPDYYGGERIGSNLYANCVVALKGATGEVVWAFQVVHHDIWDYDVPSQPALITVTKDGEEIDAVCQATKMGHVFFLNRDTGEPIFPVEEREVPQSDVPGEESWPTQPFPVVTPALVPSTLTAEDAWGLTPWDKGKVREMLTGLRSEGLFTPPGLEGSIHFPGVAGGTNWGSMAFDPERRIVVMNTSRVPFKITLRTREQYGAEMGTPMDVERGGMRGTPYAMYREPLISPLGIPVNAPPWGTLVAISTETGKVAWESTLGTVRDLSPVPIGIKWGTPNMGGPLMAESGLVFISATMDYYLRAFDSESGEELWKGRLPAGGQATPMTYRLSENGKQYVVICAGGHGRMGTKLGDYVLAFALPEK